MLMNMMQAHKHTTYWTDQYGRSKRKLRISVTDRCNFKCVYCMPEHPRWAKKHDLLTFEELLTFCTLMVEHGIESIRITGGEPLMRQGVTHFIRDLQKLRPMGLKRISMTTNGHYLAQHAQALKKAGLDDLNISLDSLNPATFYQLTQKSIGPVLLGITAAQAVGFPVKINTVLIKGVNDQEIFDLMRWSIQQNLLLRFIEFMPLDGDHHWSKAHVVSEAEILAVLGEHFEITTAMSQDVEPARQYFANAHAFGIISTITHSFCGRCDRLRLTAKGEFYNCLFATQGISLKSQIQQYKKQHSSELLTLLQQHIWQKKSGYAEISSHIPNRKISMHMLGG